MEGKFLLYVVFIVIIPYVWSQAQQRQGLQLPHIPPGSLVQVGKSSIFLYTITVAVPVLRKLHRVNVNVATDLP